VDTKHVPAWTVLKTY